MTPDLRLQVLNGVAKSGAGHRGGVAVQERKQPGLIGLAGPAEKAAHRLVDQVMRVV